LQGHKIENRSWDWIFLQFPGRTLAAIRTLWNIVQWRAERDGHRNASRARERLERLVREEERLLAVTDTGVGRFRPTEKREEYLIIISHLRNTD